MELAERHGWTDDPAFGVVGTILGLVLVGQAVARARALGLLAPSPDGGQGARAR